MITGSANNETAVGELGGWGEEVDDEKSKQQVAEGKLETGWKSPEKLCRVEGLGQGDGRNLDLTCSCSMFQWRLVLLQ